MVDEDGFGPTPHQVKIIKKHKVYQDRHLQPIGKNVTLCPCCITGLHPDLVDAVILDSSDNNTKTM
jgi:hypothetical protein